VDIPNTPNKLLGTYGQDAELAHAYFAHAQDIDSVYLVRAQFLNVCFSAPHLLLAKTASVAGIECNGLQY
jgi:hypothetical protein